MNRFSRIFFHWLPLGGVVVGLCLLVYADVQQSYRQNLYDPQVQMVEDAAAGLAAGKLPNEVVPHIAPFDAEKSLASFMAVYDKDGNVLVANATIGTDQPKPPKGVFLASKTRTDDRVTWQPDPSTRISLVVKATDNGFVAAGRNMREGEHRIQMLAERTGLGMLFLLVATFIADVIGDAMRRKMMAATQPKA